MNALFNCNQRILKLALVSALALGGATISGASFAAPTTVSASMTVDATLTSACAVSAGSAAIHFPSVTTLLGSGSVSGNSASTFQVACSSDLSPVIYSITPRNMVFTDGAGAHSLPFDLSLTSGGASLATSSAGTSLGITKNGVLQDVTLFGNILAANFTGLNALPPGAYTTNVTVSVDY